MMNTPISALGEKGEDCGELEGSLGYRVSGQKLLLEKLLQEGLSDHTSVIGAGQLASAFPGHLPSSCTTQYRT